MQNETKKETEVRLNTKSTSELGEEADCGGATDGVAKTIIKMQQRVSMVLQDKDGQHERWEEAEEGEEDGSGGEDGKDDQQQSEGDFFAQDDADERSNDGNDDEGNDVGNDST